MHFHDILAKAKKLQLETAERERGEKKQEVSGGGKKGEKREKKKYEEKIPAVIRYMTVTTTHNVAYQSSCH